MIGKKSTNGWWTMKITGIHKVSHAKQRMRKDERKERKS